MSRRQGRDPRTQVNAPIAWAGEPARFCPFLSVSIGFTFLVSWGGRSGKSERRQLLMLWLARWAEANMFSKCWRQFRQKSTPSLFFLNSSLQTWTCTAIFFSLEATCLLTSTNSAYAFFNYYIKAPKALWHEIIGDQLWLITFFNFTGHSSSCYSFCFLKPSWISIWPWKRSTLSLFQYKKNESHTFLYKERKA